MKDYEQYLKEQDYAQSTATTYDRDREQFAKWCNGHGHDMESIDYRTCLDYVKKLREGMHKKRPSKSTVRHQVGALKIYFNYLIDIDVRGDNPMGNINIRGVKRTLNHNLLEFEELEDLYYSLPTRNIKLPSSPHVAIRDKVITGLMVYQGLNPTALKVLKMEHINLDRGRIYIPGTRKTNTRELPIKAPQILSLSKYIEEDRERLQDSIGCYSDAFVPLNSERFSIISHWLFKKLRRINHNVSNAKQLRASVIVHWLKNHNIREVQYMAGHRYISSTERYVQDDLDSLHGMIEMGHPIG